jgi:hypothetical protein
MGIRKDAMKYEKKIAEAKYAFWRKYWWLFVIILVAFIVIYGFMYMYK